MSPILFLLLFQPLECGRGDQDQVTKMLYCSLRTHLPCSEKAQATHTQLCIVVPMTAQLRHQHTASISHYTCECGTLQGDSSPATIEAQPPVRTVSLNSVNPQQYYER